MKLTNQEIYDYANQLLEAFDDNNQKLPIKISFYLQKNKNTLIELAKDIEQNRLEIAKENGALKDDGLYMIDPDKIESVRQDLIDLFSLEQDVNIYTIKADNLDENLTLTMGQMEALMFMID